METLNFSDLPSNFEPPAKHLATQLRQARRPVLLHGSEPECIAFAQRIPGLLVALGLQDIAGPIQAPHFTLGEDAYLSDDRRLGMLEIAKNGVLLLTDAPMLRDLILNLIQRHAVDVLVVLGINPEFPFDKPSVWRKKRIEHVTTQFNPIIVELPRFQTRTTRCASTQELAA